MLEVIIKNFSLDDAQKYFSIIGNAKVKESEMLRYVKSKKVIEVNVEKEMQ